MDDLIYTVVEETEKNSRRKFFWWFWFFGGATLVAILIYFFYFRQANTNVGTTNYSSSTLSLSTTTGRVLGVSTTSSSTRVQMNDRADSSYDNFSNVNINNNFGESFNDFLESLDYDVVSNEVLLDQNANNNILNLTGNLNQNLISGALPLNTIPFVLGSNNTQSNTILTPATFDGSILLTTFFFNPLDPNILVSTTSKVDIIFASNVSGYKFYLDNFLNTENAASNTLVTFLKDGTYDAQFVLNYLNGTVATFTRALIIDTQAPVLRFPISSSGGATSSLVSINTTLNEEFTFYYCINTGCVVPSRNSSNTLSIDINVTRQGYERSAILYLYFTDKYGNQSVMPFTVVFDTYVEDSLVTDINFDISSSTLLSFNKISQNPLVYQGFSHVPNFSFSLFSSSSNGLSVTSNTFSTSSVSISDSLFSVVVTNLSIGTNTITLIPLNGQASGTPFTIEVNYLGSVYKPADIIFSSSSQVFTSTSTVNASSSNITFNFSPYASSSIVYINGLLVATGSPHINFIIPDGTSTVTIVTTNIDGSVATSTLTYTVDTLVPKTISTSTIIASSLNKATVTISYDLDEPSFYYYCIEFVCSSISSIATSTIRESFVVQRVDGEEYRDVIVYFVDLLGNISSSTLRVVFDLYEERGAINNVSTTNATSTQISTNTVLFSSNVPNLTVTGNSTNTTSVTIYNSGTASATAVVIGGRVDLVVENLPLGTTTILVVPTNGSSVSATSTFIFVNNGSIYNFDNTITSSTNSLVGDNYLSTSTMHGFVFNSNVVSVIAYINDVKYSTNTNSINFDLEDGQYMITFVLLHTDGSKSTSTKSIVVDTRASISLFGAAQFSYATTSVIIFTGNLDESIDVDICIEGQCTRYATSSTSTFNQTVTVTKNEGILSVPVSIVFTDRFGNSTTTQILATFDNYFEEGVFSKLQSDGRNIIKISESPLVYQILSTSTDISIVGDTLRAVELNTSITGSGIISRVIGLSSSTILVRGLSIGTNTLTITPFDGYKFAGTTTVNIILSGALTLAESIVSLYGFDLNNNTLKSSSTVTDLTFNNEVIGITILNGTSTIINSSSSNVVFSIDDGEYELILITYFANGTYSTNTINFIKDIVSPTFQILNSSSTIFSDKVIFEISASSTEFSSVMLCDISCNEIGNLSTSTTRLLSFEISADTETQKFKEFYIVLRDAFGNISTTTMLASFDKFFEEGQILFDTGNISGLNEVSDSPKIYSISTTTNLLTFRATNTLVDTISVISDSLASTSSAGSGGVFVIQLFGMPYGTTTFTLVPMSTSSKVAGTTTILVFNEGLVPDINHVYDEDLEQTVIFGTGTPHDLLQITISEFSYLPCNTGILDDGTFSCEFNTFLPDGDYLAYISYGGRGTTTYLFNHKNTASVPLVSNIKSFSSTTNQATGSVLSGNYIIIKNLNGDIVCKKEVGVGSFDCDLETVLTEGLNHFVVTEYTNSDPTNDPECINSCEIVRSYPFYVSFTVPPQIEVSVENTSSQISTTTIVGSTTIQEVFLNSSSTGLALNVSPGAVVTITITNSSGTVITSTATSTGSTFFDLDLPDGEYSLVVTTVKDGFTVTNIIKLTVDKTPPNEPSVNITDGVPIGTGDLNFTGTADQDSVVTMTIITSGGITYGCTSVKPDNIGVWSCEILETLPEGEYEYELFSKDKASNTSAVTRKRFKVNYLKNPSALNFGAVLSSENISNQITPSQTEGEPPLMSLNLSDISSLVDGDRVTLHVFLEDLVGDTFGHVLDTLAPFISDQTPQVENYDSSLSSSKPFLVKINPGSLPYPSSYQGIQVIDFGISHESTVMTGKYTGIFIKHTSASDSPCASLNLAECETLPEVIGKITFEIIDPTLAPDN